MAPRIFVSHSSEDRALAESLADLLMAALPLETKDIRCTSVERFALPPGVHIDDTIRQEVLDTEVLVGLISRAGFSSAWVLFELGARWGSRKTLIPVLAPGVSMAVLQGPIQDLNALTCGTREGLFRLVSNLEGFLGIKARQPLDFSKQLEIVLATQPARIDEKDLAAVMKFFRENDVRLYYKHPIGHSLKWDLAKVGEVADQLVQAGLLEIAYAEFGPKYRIKR